MFDLNDFYTKAHNGERQDEKGLIEYVSGFKNVVLWGASFLGMEVGKKFIELGIPITIYWDLRAEELKEVNGIKVIKPFEGEYNKDETLVVYCILNNVVGYLLLDELEEKGYHNILRGEYIYEGICCPFDVNTGIRPRECQSSMQCITTFCRRLSNIVCKKASEEMEPKDGELIHLYSITFVLNQRCTLGCKYCTSYMNSYPLEKRIDFPVERIKDDIDRFFDAVDSVATMTIMGGEPFLHKDIGEIIKKLLEKKNFGTAFITTSGTCKISPEQLESMKDERICVSFSNYHQCLSEKQLELFYKNIELVKSSGVACKVAGTMPEWAIPSTLYNLHDSEETMKIKKAACVMPSRCMQVKNGKLHPCDFATSLYNLGVADYPMDYVDIANSKSTLELRQKIREFIVQPYYKTCGHCKMCTGLTAKAGEQGFMDYITEPK